ncbi:alanine racemase [Paenibacillus sp. F411]|uniref:Alanine racemase n=1 Tax=Paenibacillus algicola TaxID=2565926 RepID=A0A4P8XMK0_9BACL|nr:MULTISPECIES: alanine racemase [Paenibacillus]MBO2943737.1 alanine racemase [Paenibacillus sp. F411]QCT04012.1 alanine racemase [Paenibacillus algicola]
MQHIYRPTQAEIDLDGLGDNLNAFRAHVPEGMKVLACVKANAYGHGAVEVSRELERLGADYLSVAFLDEALELRKAGITLPILVLGYTPPEGIMTAWEQDITVTLFSRDVLTAIQKLPKSLDRPLKLHIKIDSGMGRLGLLPEEAAAFVEEAFALPQAFIEGMFTHFARADEENKSYTLEQHRRFKSVADALREGGFSIPIIHTGNSAAAIDTPELSFNMVRIGISLYGVYPSEEVHRTAVSLRPVMTLKTQAVYVKTLPPQSGVSYGSRYVTEEEERIATLPVGYADGYSRMLSGNAEVLIRGRRAPVVGSICMDQCMVSLKHFAEEAEQIKAGEEVVLIGRQSGECISADELASRLGTIPYELVCMIAHRVPRTYIRGGMPITRVNPLL